MLAVAEAQRRILEAFGPLPPEILPLTQGLGRVLTQDLTARVTQPPAAVSAMDGYAVRAADVASVPVTLKIVGYVPAGQHYAKRLEAGQAVRIFTGAPLPEGADAIVIQEDAAAEGDRVTLREAATAGRWVRAAGLDFKAGEACLLAGRRLTPRDIGLAAAMDRPWLSVHRRPRVAVLATGDEVVMPGEPRGPDQIVSSNALALSAFLQAQGAEAINLGIAPDRPEALQQAAAGAAGADLIVTTGGASVGEHDLVQSALGQKGLVVDFWKIAMRPGKPLIFGRLGATPLLGLPGNPVSTLVCALIFLRPVLRRLQGLEPIEPPLVARLKAPLAANDRRQDYLRSKVIRDEGGQLWAEPFRRQDSSMLRLLADAQGLVIRPPEAPALVAGAEVPLLPLEGL
jgi:molybdopterin molybdotransferase